jgi:prevent-host-death family protein
MKEWQLQDAKAKLSQLVKIAESDGPQYITVHGERAVVVLSATEYKKLTTKNESLVTFLKKSPLANTELNLKRDKSRDRDVEL